MADKKVLYHSRTHGKALLPAVFVLIFLVLLEVLLWSFLPRDTQWPLFNQWAPIVLHGAVLLIFLWYVLLPYLRWRSETFTLTAHSIRNDWGLLNRDSREVELSRIASISEERDFIDRIFSCGTLNFYDAAAGAQPETKGSWNSPRERNTAGVRFHDVPHVKHVRELIETARDKAEHHG